MATIFPGATWVPVPGQEKRAKRRKGRGVGYHVAVYVGPSIEKIDEGTGNDSHLYVRFDGSVEQNVDLDLVSYAGVDGNATMIWVETEGGANPATVNSEPWTPAQAVTLARIARWAHDTEGAPLELMPDSKPASRGLSTHRLGIQHSAGIGAVPGWLVAGGERWSTHIGKECPGDAKVAQLPQILTLARSGPPIQEDDMPLTQPDLNGVSDSVANRGIGTWPDGSSMEAWEAWRGAALDARTAAAQATATAQQVAGLTAAVSQLAHALAAQQGIDPAALKTTITEAIAASVVHVDVTVAGPAPAGA